MSDTEPLVKESKILGAELIPMNKPEYLSSVVF